MEALTWFQYWEHFAGAAVDGFTLNSNNNKIQGLDITDFSGNGIVINGDNNFIGVDGDGYR